MILYTFLREFVLRRKMIRPELGNAILPLIMLEMVGELDYYNFPWTLESHRKILLTLHRKSGIVYFSGDLSKIYSANSYLDYDAQNIEILGIADMRKSLGCILPTIFVKTSY